MASCLPFVLAAHTLLTRYSPQVSVSHSVLNWTISVAPESGDVVWENLGYRFAERHVRAWLVGFATAAALVFFLAPVTLVQGLASLGARPALSASPLDPSVFFLTTWLEKLTTTQTRWKRLCRASSRSRTRAPSWLCVGGGHVNFVLS